MPDRAQGALEEKGQQEARAADMSVRVKGPKKDLGPI